MDERTRHWERVYASLPSERVSWFQTTPTVSLELLEATGLSAAT